MPYLRVSCPSIDALQRRDIAARLTDAVVELFTPPRGPSREEIRARTSVQFACYGPDELFVAAQPAGPSQPDVTVELSDWSMSPRHQGRVAARLTPLLVELFGADTDAVNLRFHPYPPTDFAVGGRLLSTRIPRIARLAKRILN